MTTQRLWTFQRQEIVPLLESSDVFFASWETTPQNFRIGYRWMVAELNKALGHRQESPPIWCWHSCNGIWESPPIVGTARALLSEYDFEQGMALIELRVPSNLMLLSSYYAWNRILDSTLVRQRPPHSLRRHKFVFGEPLIRHRGDDVQAVIPFIRRDWIQGISKLSIEGRDWEEHLTAA